MRYYLDTNILVFLLFEAKEDISKDVYMLITDCSSILMTSVICVNELIYLYQREKVGYTVKKQNKLKASKIVSLVKGFNIKIVPAKESHLEACAALPLHEDNKDPNDRLIVAQAIADRIPLISSDRKFNEYIQDGLDFIYNER